MKSNSAVKFYLIMGFALIPFGSCTKEEAKDPENFTYGAVKDVDGNVYKTIKIDFSSGGSKGSEAAKAVTQTWMVENLKTTRFSNGDLIETTTPATLDISIYLQDYFAYQWAYGGNESNVDAYGRLYTWIASMDIRNICPDGWHVPTKYEWSQLAEYLGGKFVEDWEGMGSWGNNVGGKLKEAGTTHWISPNKEATNSIGFTALPGGLRSSMDGLNFQAISYMGLWWSSTEDLNRAYRWAWTYSMSYSNGWLGVVARHVNEGLSVRCMQQTN
jgi:uncharacterized protein (TIGR02145 family)